MSLSVLYPGPGCPACAAPLDREPPPDGSMECPRCRARFEAVAFAPEAPRLRVAQVAEAGPEGAVPCGAHPANASAFSCTRCGVYMCALCQVEIDGQVLCPPCFDRLSSDGVLPSTRVVFKDYLRMALISFVAGLLIFVAGAAFGAATIYYSLMALKQRRTMQEPQGVTSARLLLGLGALETVGGLALGLFLLKEIVKQ
jgi:hypothetical protein